MTPKEAAEQICASITSAGEYWLKHARIDFCEVIQQCVDSELERAAAELDELFNNAVDKCSLQCVDAARQVREMKGGDNG